MAVIYGTTGPDQKNGTSENDTIYGWAKGGNANSPSGKDTLNGKAGNDKLYGGTDNDSLYGDQGNDTLYGNSGKDYLSGGRGNDQLRGDSGNDSLRGWENNDSLYGDKGNDTLDGGLGNDTLDGGLGSDTLNGGLGNDTYIVNSNTDRITGEGANGGTDTVRSSVNWTLGANLENLTLTGDSPISGTGNALDNTIIGNGASNSLAGGDGNDYLTGIEFEYDGLNNFANEDTLTGGTGADIFRFYNPAQNVTITDFVVVDDTIYVNSIYSTGFDGSTFFQFEGFGFEGLSFDGSGLEVLTPGATITKEQFVIGSVARDTSDRFIYNQNTGALFFDADGTDTNYEQKQFATLPTGLAMTNTDIFVA